MVEAEMHHMTSRTHNVLKDSGWKLACHHFWTTLLCSSKSHDKTNINGAATYTLPPVKVTQMSHDKYCTFKRYTEMGMMTLFTTNYRKNI